MVHYKPVSHKLVAEQECAIEVCMEREARRKKTYAPKEIYSRALEGKASTVPGMGQSYEPPLNPKVTIDMAQHTPEQAAERLLTSATRLSKDI
jgi:adenylylsulfate kinase-like enzyme